VLEILLPFDQQDVENAAAPGLGGDIMIIEDFMSSLGFESIEENKEDESWWTVRSKRELQYHIDSQLGPR
jgi:hypothetical protein